jgi:uncharacterized protein (DUF58 family)
MLFRARRDPAADLPAAPESLAAVLAEVRRIELQSRRLVTDVLAGGYRSTFRGAGVEFADVREYVEGDDPRSVDWNVTARVGRPFVKRFVEERELTVLFALDLSASMHGGLGAWSLRQAAARFVALMGLAAIANNDRIGLIAGGGEVQRFVPPRKGAGHVLRVVRDVLLLQPTTPGTNLPALAAEALRRLRRRTIVFLLTDMLPLPTAGRDLALCGARHDTVAVWLQAHELLQPPPLLLRSRAPETGAQQLLDLRHPAVRAAQAQRVAAWLEDGRGLLQRARIDCVELPLPAQPDLQALVTPLQRFFRRRELREARR